MPNNGPHVGPLPDPAAILEIILNQVEGEQAKHITTMYLDSLSATLHANLKFLQGARAVLAGKVVKSQD
jgi:hypothetical protein